MAKQLPLHFEFRADLTFNNFYPGNNQEIINHLQNCVAGTGEQQIFLWGSQGLGKSHLLQACCCQAYTLGFRSFYFSFSGSSLPDPTILNGLDEIDIVCFDNIECFTGNPAWEMAFFNFFNQHRDRGHKLIISAHCAPNDLGIQLPDLQTRLNWGLALKMRPLDDQGRIAALTFKANQMGFEISSKAGRFLLTHYSRDLSSLWALLEKLDQASLAAKRKLTIPFLKQVMDDNYV